jgi:hypothetical protein
MSLIAKWPWVYRLGYLAFVGVDQQQRRCCSEAKIMHQCVAFILSLSAVAHWFSLVFPFLLLVFKM